LIHKKLIDHKTWTLFRIGGANTDVYYILYITIIDFAVLLIMSIMAHSNALMKQKQKN